MERQTYTNTNRYLFLFLIALMVSCSKSDVQIAKSLNKEIAIYPDYKDVTIPVNIAPLINHALVIILQVPLIDI